jgi:hydrogenase large subunit
MSSKKIVNLALNRIEGDLEIKIEFDGKKITDAWCIGTMFRGFEQIMMGRAAMDGLVITPRICGICGTSHLYAAVTALETAYQCPIAPNGTRIRNLCLMAEEVQSDLRHTFLMFTIDFCNKRYEGLADYPRILEAFEPFKGRFYRETIQNTKKILEIVAIFGGQWPHSSYMIPGGITLAPSQRDLIRALSILDTQIKWYENSILGCSSEKWLSLKSVADFDHWLKDKQEHQGTTTSMWPGFLKTKTKTKTHPQEQKTPPSSAIELFASFGSSIGLHKLGKSEGNLLSYGAFFDPDNWQPPFNKRHCVFAPGFYNARSGRIETFSSGGVKEHLRYSWYDGQDGGYHPWEGDTIPNYAPDSEKYSWAKAPRYKDTVVEVGPLAELVVAGDPLITDFFRQEGSNAWLRQFSRLHRPVVTMQLMREMIRETLTNINEPFYQEPSKLGDGEGEGLIQAARGCLGHWIKLKNQKIEKYQIITPTAWNASPRDSDSRLGHWEKTLIGTEIRDIDNPIEVGHIVRSHDACLVCTVHFLDAGKKMRFHLPGGTMS